jgi:hypothetical protein
MVLSRMNILALYDSLEDRFAPPVGPIPVVINDVDDPCCIVCTENDDRLHARAFFCEANEFLKVLLRYLSAVPDDDATLRWR